MDTSNSVDLTRALVLRCYDALHGADSRSKGHHTPRQLVSIFSGSLPYNTATAGGNELDPELKALALKAFRYAVKLALDQALMGSECTDPEDAEEVEESLLEFDADWHLGPERERPWGEAVAGKKGSLFSVGMEGGEDGRSGTVLSHLLSTQQVAVHVGKLNRAAVEGQWASLHFELLYLANDDDERYSVQAHPILLRNLTVQAADPPLGYPIYNRRLALPV